MRLLPRIDIGRWCGGDIDGRGYIEGASLCIQWGPLFLEFAIGKREA